MLRVTILCVQAVCIMLTGPSCPRTQEAAPDEPQAPARAVTGTQATAPQPAPVRARVGKHAIHTEQLQTIMAGLGREVTKTWPQEMEPPPSSGNARRYEEARHVAAALVDAAQRLPNALEGVSLTDEERKAFMAGVRSLSDYARRLESAAGRRREREMRTALRSIESTCNSCHERFREIAGPIHFGWQH